MRRWYLSSILLSDLSLFSYTSGHSIMPWGLPALGKAFWENNDRGKKNRTLTLMRLCIQIVTLANNFSVQARAWAMFSHGKTTQEWLQRAHRALGHGRSLVTRTRLASRELLESLLRTIILEWGLRFAWDILAFFPFDCCHLSQKVTHSRCYTKYHIYSWRSPVPLRTRFAMSS